MFDYRALRKAAKLTLKAVSFQSGLSLSFISDIERGRTQPSLGTLERLVKVYGYRVVLEKSND